MNRNWAIQYEPKGALRATALRYLSIDKGISLNKLSQMVFDDLMAVVFWDRCDPPERGRPKIFCHALGSPYMDTKRRTVRDDLSSALDSLEACGVVARDAEKKKYLLTTYQARALWLSKMPTDVLTIYQGLRATHPGDEKRGKGMDIFDRDGTLKDKRDETIRQQAIEIELLKARLKDANAFLKIQRESEVRKLEKQLR